ncbi:MAG: DUF1015 domain-containing protein [Candidatus Dormibacteria bacterium]
MAEVRAFRGVTYNPGREDLGLLLCPPYDVISAAQQAAYYDRSPHNAVRIVLNRSPGAARYPAAAAELQGWLADGTLRRAEAPALYVHRESFTEPGTEVERQRTGVIATVRLEPWGAGAVLPHEHTMPGPKLDRLELMRATEADTEPIWVFQPDPAGVVRETLDEVSRRPPMLRAHFEPESDSVAPILPETHELWEVTDPVQVARLTGLLSQAQLYIADGHHRYETALHHADEVGGPADAASRFKVVLISPLEDPGLLVLPTHRLVKFPPGHSLGALLADLRAAGWSSEQPGDLEGMLDAMSRPTGPGILGLGLFAERRFSHLAGRDPSGGNRGSSLPPSIASLDVALLHEWILAPLTGVGMELAGTEYLAFSRDAREVCARVESGEFDAGFFLRAPTLDQVRAVADAGENMPQKSTYFWPKPASGLVLALHAAAERI